MANVVFLWHMHQPYYVNPATRTAMMPWVRLHCVKGYCDMISVIEDFPRVRMNFNLTPVLLLQIKQLIDGDISDLWLEWSRKPAASLTESDRMSILENFFKINWDNLLRPFPRYRELLNKRGLTFYRDEVRRGLRYFSDQEFLDLQVWFNLAWCGYTAVQLFPELAELRAKGRDFTEEEKSRVLGIHLELMRTTLRKYAEAEGRGQVELTTTPFFHPILPLVYDSSFAERSLPGRDFPRRFHWPQDAEAQLKLAVELHEKLLGRKPRGLWPSEGSIAPELIPLMQQVGIQYFCSDEENLFNSIKRDPSYNGVHVDHIELFQGWRIQFDGAAVNALFREKPLSDFIGFMAARNEPGRAAEHLLIHLKHIAGLVPADTGVIPLILDGENAWEAFADGGEAFLRALYGGIEQESTALHSCTIEDFFTHHPPARQLATLHTGSWIGSNFDIWIGEEDENRAWDLLGDARNFLQQRIDAGVLAPNSTEEALMEIYAAEGSDWFWWFGPDFSTENDALFDELFRQHLKNVYSICGGVPPAELDHPIGRVQFVSLYQEPTQLLSPVIDGMLGSYFEWNGAGLYVAGTEQGAMHRAERFMQRMFFGFGEEFLYLRLDLANWDSVSLVVRFLQPYGYVASSGPVRRGRIQPFTLSTPVNGEVRRDTLRADDIVEWGIALSDLEVRPAQPVSFLLKIFKDGIERESYPEAGPIQLVVPTADFAMQSWMV
jgi:alpha-amylase/alpha-mannosidase (GH57 family)